MASNVSPMRFLIWPQLEAVQRKLLLQTVGPQYLSDDARLVDTSTIPMLLKLVCSGKLHPGKLVTHRFAINDIMKAYDVFGNAARESALKVILKNEGEPQIHS